MKKLNNKGQTIIVITHDKELMKISDKLIVLKAGKIDSICKHYDLIISSKIYRNLQK